MRYGSRWRDVLTAVPLLLSMGAVACTVPEDEPREPEARPSLTAAQINTEPKAAPPTEDPSIDLSLFRDLRQRQRRPRHLRRRRPVPRHLRQRQQRSRHLCRPLSLRRMTMTGPWVSSLESSSSAKAIDAEPEIEPLNRIRPIVIAIN